LSDTYYISTAVQYPTGIIGYDSNGDPIFVGGRFDHLYEIETNNPNSVVAKAVESGCAVRACPKTISVSFEVGSEAGSSFAKSLGAKLPARSRVRLHVDGDTATYVFDKTYALGR
jgi:hypothetical protein